MYAIENSLMSSKGIGLRSHMLLLKASVKALSHVIIQCLNALSFGLRPVEGLIGPRRFHYCRPGGIAFKLGVVRNHPSGQDCPLAGQRRGPGGNSRTHKDPQKHCD
jgi:hypothetical protein